MKNILNHIRANRAPWFKQWFDSMYYHNLYANRDDNEAAGFIDELVHELQPASNATMLDLGCGRGRHAKHLAQKGFIVVGLDIAFSSIREARQHETPQLQFCCHDMRRPFGTNCFDYIFNCFTSFGYFNTLAENDAVVQNMARALTPGGTVVIDYLNVAVAEKKLVPKEQKEVDGIVYNITRWDNDDYFFKRIDITDKQWQQTFDYTEQVAKFRLADFDCLFKHNGLQLEGVYGDYALNNYNAEISPRLIMTAKKI